jgi:hypothetical protein
MSVSIDGEYDLVNAVLLRRTLYICTDLLTNCYTRSLTRDTPDTFFLVSQILFPINTSYSFSPTVSHLSES